MSGGGRRVQMVVVGADDAVEEDRRDAVEVLVFEVAGATLLVASGTGETLQHREDNKE